MGTDTRMATTQAMRDVGDDQLPIERNFYKKMGPAILFSGWAESVPPALKDTFEASFSDVFVSQKFPDKYLHENYTYLVANEAFNGSKDSLLLDLTATAFARETMRIRVAIRSCVADDSTAFVVYQSSWDFVSADNIHFREESVRTQTWTLNSKSWQIIGEYWDSIKVEPVAKIS